MKRKSLASTFNEQMRRIHKLYLQSGGTLPVILDDLFAFAMRNNLWEPQPADVRKQFCKQMAIALREDYFVDAKGRNVRKNHAIFTTGYDEEGNKKKIASWDTIDTAPREHMEGAFQLRRKQIVGDCRQLKNDADYYNEKKEFTNPIRLLFDMTDDLIESELPTEYTPDEDADAPDIVS